LLRPRTLADYPDGSRFSTFASVPFPSWTSPVRARSPALFSAAESRGCAAVCSAPAVARSAYEAWARAAEHLPGVELRERSCQPPAEGQEAQSRCCRVPARAPSSRRRAGAPPPLPRCRRIAVVAPRGKPAARRLGEGIPFARAEIPLADRGGRANRRGALPCARPAAADREGRGPPDRVDGGRTGERGRRGEGHHAPSQGPRARVATGATFAFLLVPVERRNEAKVGEPHRNRKLRRAAT
jgi:hypothetical protein